MGGRYGSGESSPEDGVIMSFWSRITNCFRTDRLNREIDEELESHVAFAVEAGSDPDEARRALGPRLRHREASRDTQIAVWLDSLRADAVFGLRQLRKNWVTSAAAVLSLALAMGACTAAFRLIDALLLRPLPISEPERLYAFLRQSPGPDGAPRTFDGVAYPMFQQMRAAAKGQAEVLAISYAERVDLTYGSDAEMEKAYWQFVSGWMFHSFGIRPALGRVLSESDDVTPKGHPAAILSHDYWIRRFGGDPNVIGRTFRMGTDVYEIAGVSGEGFTGTEPGTMVDVFVPTMMHASVTRVDSTWLRPLIRMEPGASPQALRNQLQAVAVGFEQERAKSFRDLPKEFVARLLNQTVILESAPSGASGLQMKNRVALRALAAVVALVLLIACANLANLMAVRAAARAREMALRVSIGAGRGRVLQLILVESAWIAVLATVAGIAFASWATPFIVSMLNPADNPVRLALPADLRVAGFSVLLTLTVTLLFGLAPAIGASEARPFTELKGGGDTRTKRRSMFALIAAQVAFSGVVLLTGGLFVETYRQLAHQPTGFSSDRLLALQTVTAQPQPPIAWSQVATDLAGLPGIESVTLADRPLLNGGAWNGFVSIDGSVPGNTLAFFRSVSPGWLDAMKIPLLDGRDFQNRDVFPGAAIVNETFARTFFGGENPVGKSFHRGTNERHLIVGLVRDTRYRNMRDPIYPAAFFPFAAMNSRGLPQPRSEAALIVRTATQDSLAAASLLRHEVSRAHPGFRVSSIRTQQEINDAHTVSERLLAMLALFFGAVALLLAGVGLYGVLDHSVLQRRREIGIRMALGGTAATVARQVTLHSFLAVLLGAAAGLGGGILAERYISSLLYQIRATDPLLLALPTVLLLAAALLAVTPPALRATRTDPAETLRTD